MSEFPTVSVVVPCRNERGHIERCVKSILDNDHDDFELVVVDGMSTDGTSELVAQYAQADSRVRVLKNETGRIPDALNIGVASARGSVLIRLDAHSACPPYFVSRLESYLRAIGGASGVGGQVVTQPSRSTLRGRALAAALSHWFGVGNPRYRFGTVRPAEVDTIMNGCYWRSELLKVFPLDKRVHFTEDVLMHQRLRENGGRLFLVPDVTSTYFSRSGVWESLRHSWRNGLWVILPSVYTDGLVVAARHLVPAGFAAALYIGVLALLVSRGIGSLTVGGLLGIYGLCAGLAAIDLARRKRDAALAVVMPGIFLIRHLTYGTATLWGLLRFTLHRLSWWRS